MIIFPLPALTSPNHRCPEMQVTLAHWLRCAPVLSMRPNLHIDCQAYDLEPPKMFWLHRIYASVDTENGLVQICDKVAIKAQINDERLLNRGSYSFLKYSNNGDAVSLKCSIDGSVLLLFNNGKWWFKKVKILLDKCLCFLK